MKNLKNLLLTILIFAPLALWAQVDSLAVPANGGIFGLSWVAIFGILGGLELILRVLPIPKKVSILSLIAYLINAIPSNTPKSEQQ